ncbi:MAG: glycosyltransferase [Sphingorhabdus sp.]
MNDRLRVLQLSTQGPLYGAERWILALMRTLDPAKIESQLAVIVDDPGTPAPLLAEAERLGFTKHAISAPGRLNLAAVRLLREIVAREAINVVHCHGYKPDLIALLAKSGLSAKLIATPHGWSRKAGGKLAFYEWLDRQMMHRFDAIAPLSTELLASLSAGASAKAQLIPNGVDLDECDNAQTAPHPFACAYSGPVIGYVGQLIARKDIATLLRAFARWGRRDANLMLVGEGPERHSLEALANELGIAHQVYFTGFRPDRLELMKRFDLFVLPSLAEGIPRCLMEAMALRIPVVASDIAGNTDLLEDAKCGILFPPGDSKALTAAFESALFDNQRQNRIERARTVVESRHSARAMAVAYERLFTRLVDNK